jgi:uncharacterized protein
MTHVLSPSKITAWMACEHYLTLKFRGEVGNSDQNKTNEEIKRNESGDLVISPPKDFSDLLQKKGILHEQECLKRYREKYPDQEAVFEVDQADWQGGETFSGWKDRVGDPNPLEVGYPIIFQMPFIYEGIRGIADFLEKKDGTYEPVDSKLSRTGAKPGHLLQLLFYAEAVEANPDISKRPEEVHVDLGSGESQSFSVSKFWWYWKHLRQKLEKVVEIGGAAKTEPKKCSFCGMCEFRNKCFSEWKEKDSLILLSGSHSKHREALEEAGITTLRGLAELPKKTLEVLLDDQGSETSEFPMNLDMEEEIEADFSQVMPEVSDGIFQDAKPDLKVKHLVRLWKQARLQLIAREKNLAIKDSPVHLFSEVEMIEKMEGRQGWKKGESLLHLPECSDYDIYLDFEGHPFLTAKEGIIFLFGYLEKVDGEWVYVSRWSHDVETGNPSKDREKEEARNLVRFFHQRWKESEENGADMHVYHYNHTERSLMAELTTDTSHASHIVDIFGQMLGAEVSAEDLSDRKLLDELIENGVFVDLLAIVRNSLQAGLESYSLKLMEQLAGFDREDAGETSENVQVTGDSSSSDVSGNLEVSDGSGAVLRYELYANHKLYGQERDESHLDEIAKYNKEDVDATQALHRWLLKKRFEAEHLPNEVVELSADPEIFTGGWVAERVENLKDEILKRVSA